MGESGEFIAIGEFEVGSSWYGFENGISFSDHTLFVASASVANIGQLTAEAMIANVAGVDGTQCLKAGRIYHPALEAVVGSDPEGEKEESLITACELYTSNPDSRKDDDFKYVIMLFRAPVGKKGRKDFGEFLSTWICQQRFNTVVCLSSLLGSTRNDGDLAASVTRYVSTDLIPPAIVEKLEKLEWIPMTSMGENQENQDFNWLGSGIIKYIYKSCLRDSIPFLGLMMFASDEGDNTPQALVMLEALDEIFVIRDPEAKRRHAALIIPISWQQFGTQSNMSGIF